MQAQVKGELYLILGLFLFSFNWRSTCGRSNRRSYRCFCRVFLESFFGVITHLTFRSVRDADADSAPKDIWSLIFPTIANPSECTAASAPSDKFGRIGEFRNDPALLNIREQTVTLESWQ
jgi:hypothetical protein